MTNKKFSISTIFLFSTTLLAIILIFISKSVNPTVSIFLTMILIILAIANYLLNEKDSEIKKLKEEISSSKQMYRDFFRKNIFNPEICRFTEKELEKIIALCDAYGYKIKLLTKYPGNYSITVEKGTFFTGFDYIVENSENTVA